MRIRLTGDDEQISAHAITGISLILHELATNAVKYGALSNASGRLSITWRHSAALEIDWLERGGPAVTPLSHNGFGSTLTQRTVERQFRGTIEHDWNLDGLAVRIVRLSIAWWPTDRATNGIRFTRSDVTIDVASVRRVGRTPGDDEV